jgi:quinol-cytochrome oxidoreductase complex cytochrome b subunit
MMAIAFTGYVLSWSQMSYWAAVVISSLVRTLPVWGQDLLVWVWGGFSVGTPTLKLFFVLHFLLPWGALLLVLVHLLALHGVGSSTSLGYSGSLGKVPFFPTY